MCVEVVGALPQRLLQWCLRDFSAARACMYAQLQLT